MIVPSPDHSCSLNSFMLDVHNTCSHIQVIVLMWYCVEKKWRPSLRCTLLKTHTKWRQNFTFFDSPQAVLRAPSFRALSLASMVDAVRAPRRAGELGGLGCGRGLSRIWLFAVATRLSTPPHLLRVSAAAARPHGLALGEPAGVVARGRGSARVRRVWPFAAALHHGAARRRSRLSSAAAARTRPCDPGTAARGTAGGLRCGARFSSLSHACPAAPPPSTSRNRRWWSLTARGGRNSPMRLVRAPGSHSRRVGVATTSASARRAAHTAGCRAPHSGL